MTWGKVSDDLHAHPKWRAVSPDAKALWVTALSYCGAYLTNGVVARGEAAGLLAVETFGANPQAFDRYEAAAAELVRAKLWTRRASGWAFHQWTEHNPAAEDEKARKGRLTRSKQLHRTTAGRRIKADVIRRDRDRCRYCRAELVTAEQRAELADDLPLRTFDHVDPHGPNSVENVVLACPDCNTRKNGRTLQEAGMTLLPAPSGGTDPRGARQSAAGSGQETRDDARTTRQKRAIGDEVPRSSTLQGSPGTGRDGTGRDGQGRATGTGTGTGTGSATGDGLRVLEGGAA